MYPRPPNFFSSWIPNFPLIAKPLYEATKGCLDEPFFNPFSLANPLHQLTQSLLRVPTLHLPDHTRPFFVFAHSNQGHALGFLCQQARDTWAPIAYLSKQLDMVTKGWPPCIQAMAAIAALVPEANKLSRKPLEQSVLHTPSETYYHIGLSSPFPLPGYRSYILFSSTLSSHSPLALPLTLPAYYPCPLQQTPSYIAAA